MYVTAYTRAPRPPTATTATTGAEEVWHADGVQYTGVFLLAVAAACAARFALTALTGPVHL